MRTMVRAGLRVKGLGNPEGPRCHCEGWKLSTLLPPHTHCPLQTLPLGRRTGWVSMFRVGVVTECEVHPPGLCLVSCLRWSQVLRSSGSCQSWCSENPAQDDSTCLFSGLVDLGRYTVFTNIYQLH